MTLFVYFEPFSRVVLVSVAFLENKCPCLIDAGEIFTRILGLYRTVSHLLRSRFGGFLKNKYIIFTTV